MGLFDSKPKQQLRNINGYIIDEIGQLVDVPAGLKVYNIPKEVKILNPELNFEKNKVLVKLREAEEIVFEDGGIEKLPADYFTFGSKSKVKKIKLPNGLTYLGDRSIDAVTVDYNLPVTIEYLGKDMYPNASKIVVPSGTKNLGKMFASHDTNLTYIEVPGSIKKLPTCFVNQCRNLKTLILHEGIEEADINAFFGLNSLEYLELPESFKVPFETAMEPRGLSSKRGNSVYNGGNGVFEAQQNEALTIKKTYNGVPYTFQVRRGEFKAVEFKEMSAIITSSDGNRMTIDLSKLDSRSVYLVNIKEGKISQAPTKQPQQPVQNQTPVKPTPQFQQSPQPVTPKPIVPTPNVPNKEEQLDLEFQRIYRERIIPSELFQSLSPIDKMEVRKRLHQYFNNIAKIQGTMHFPESILDSPFINIVNEIRPIQQSIPKPTSPAGGDPLDSGYTEAEITAMLQEILFEYVYKTDYYQKLDSKIKMQLHAPFNEEIRKRLKSLKKGQQLDIDAINYLLEAQVEKLNAQKTDSEALLQEQARQAELERLKQAKQQLPTDEEVMSEEKDEGMSM